MWRRVDHGARVRIIERRGEAFRPSRALILHPRTLEALRPLFEADETLKTLGAPPDVEPGERSAGNLADAICAVLTARRGVSS